LDDFPDLIDTVGFRSGKRVYDRRVYTYTISNSFSRGAYSYYTGKKAFIIKRLDNKKQKRRTIWTD